MVYRPWSRPSPRFWARPGRGETRSGTSPPGCSASPELRPPWTRPSTGGGGGAGVRGGRRSWAPRFLHVCSLHPDANTANSPAKGQAGSALHWPSRHHRCPAVSRRPEENLTSRSEPPAPQQGRASSPTPPPSPPLPAFTCQQPHHSTQPLSPRSKVGAPLTTPHSSTPARQHPSPAGPSPSSPSPRRLCAQNGQGCVRGAAGVAARCQ